MSDKNMLDRRQFVKSVVLAGATLAASGVVGTNKAFARNTQGRVHGVCFMGGKNCKVTYVDDGVVPGRDNGIDFYTFPSSGTNPLDSGGNYNPNRLQNNTFARGGKYWLMWKAESSSMRLFASTDGTATIESTAAAPPNAPSRDLTLNPFKSEEEILAAVARGEIVVTNLQVVVDCPITDANPGDIAVDLNPTVGPFCNKSS